MAQQLISRSVVCLSNYLCLLRIVKHVKTILHVGAAYEQSYGKGLVHMYWAGSFVLNGDLLGQALNELNLIRCLVCPQSRCPKRTALNAVLWYICRKGYLGDDFRGVCFVLCVSNDHHSRDTVQTIWEVDLGLSISFEVIILFLGFGIFMANISCRIYETQWYFPCAKNIWITNYIYIASNLTWNVKHGVRAKICFWRIKTYNEYSLYEWICLSVYQ